MCFHRLIFSLILSAISLTEAFGHATTSSNKGDSIVVVIPHLTHEEMFEDFDYLEEIVSNIHPFINLYKLNFGYDISERLRAYKRRIPEVKSTIDFVYLIHHAINACHGKHFDIYPINISLYMSLDLLKNYYSHHVDLNSIRLTHHYLKKINAFSKSIKLNIPLIYFGGEYFVKHDFYHQGIRFTRGLRLITCNNIHIHELVNRIHDERSMLPWDIENQRYFWTNFYRSHYFHGDDQISMVFLDQSGKIVKASFRLSENVKIISPTTRSKPDVFYLHEWKALFLRMPAMRPKDVSMYIKKIKLFAALNPIKLVIIDIRDNQGGSDWTWRKVLKTILPLGGLKYSVTMGLKNTGDALDYLKRHSIGRTWRYWKARTIPYLANEEFLVYTDDIHIKSDWTSINYKGKIYIIVDNIYSSAGSLADAASKSDRLITVGRSNPFPLGAGIDPFVFTLPNSRLVFRIDPLIDLTDAKSAADVLHTDVEIAVHPTLEEMLEYYNFRGDLNSEENIYRMDPFVRQIINREDQRKNMVLSATFSILLTLLHRLM